MKLPELCACLETEFGVELKREERGDGCAYYWGVVKKAPASTRLLRISATVAGEAAEIKLAQSSIAAGHDRLLPLPASPQQVAAALRSELSLLQAVTPPQRQMPSVSPDNAVTDPRVARLASVDDCESFAVNARERGFPELADQARRRSVQLRAAACEAKTEVERECLQAVFAYEEVLSAGQERRRRASRTWQMIRRLGIVPAVEHVVTKREVSAGFTALARMGLMDYAFEAVILRHPDMFSGKAVEISRQRTGAS